MSSFYASLTWPRRRLSPVESHLAKHEGLEGIRETARETFRFKKPLDLVVFVRWESARVKAIELIVIDTCLPAGWQALLPHCLLLKRLWFVSFQYVTRLYSKGGVWALHLELEQSRVKPDLWEKWNRCVPLWLRLVKINLLNQNNLIGYIEILHNDFLVFLCKKLLS